MYHSITFGEPNNCKNTWEDWHLIPSSKPVVNPPEYKEKMVDIPGSHGMLDLTEIFGAVLYGNREGELSFIMDPNYLPAEQLQQTILNYLHGKRIKMVLEDDPMYYYIGRFKVSKIQPGANYSGITIEYNLGPFKYRIDSGAGVL